jgi:hypothetical protein
LSPAGSDTTGAGGNVGADGTAGFAAMGAGCGFGASDLAGAIGAIVAGAGDDTFGSEAALDRRLATIFFSAAMLSSETATVFTPEVFSRRSSSVRACRAFRIEVFRACG